jgi:hypothetical protein
MARISEQDRSGDDADGRDDPPRVHDQLQSESLEDPGQSAAAAPRPSASRRPFPCVNLDSRAARTKASFPIAGSAKRARRTFDSAARQIRATRAAVISGFPRSRRTCAILR